MRAVAFVLAAIVSLAVLAMGCTSIVVTACHDSGAPYTHERPTRPFKPISSDAWFSDGEPTVLTVHNPTAERRLIHVVCNPSVDVNYIDRGHIEGYFCLGAHQEAMRLVEFMNIDAMAQVCYVADAEAVECAH